MAIVSGWARKLREELRLREMVDIPLTGYCRSRMTSARESEALSPRCREVSDPKKTPQQLVRSWKGSYRARQAPGCVRSQIVALPQLNHSEE